MGPGAVPWASPPWVVSLCGLCSMEASSLLDFLGWQLKVSKACVPVPRERVPSWTAFLCHGFRSPAESLLPHVLLKKQVIRPVLKGKIIRVHLLVEECQKDL